MSLRYIFSINAGRSGSGYLAALLSRAEDTVSVHEGFPIMNGAPMQAFNAGDPSELSRLMPRKMEAIHRMRGQDDTVYCETNHSYIKGWGHLLPNNYVSQEDIGIVVLSRNIEKIVRSLLRLRDVPGANEWSRTWYLLPDAEKNLVDIPDQLDPYALCEWYVHEIRRRAEAYRDRFPDITYFECDLEELNDYSFVRKMFKRFGLSPTKGLREVCGKVVNTRDEWQRTSFEELVTVRKYPNPDHHSPDVRDSLIQEMVAYLHANRSEAIGGIERDFTRGGTLVPAVTRIVASLEEELETQFECQLKYTETEWILIWEFLHSIDSSDIIFSAVQRSPAPGVCYTYDFNFALNVSTLARRMGLHIYFKIARLKLEALWKGEDIHWAGNPL